jgi:hypothetical protein
MCLKETVSAIISTLVKPKRKEEITIEGVTKEEFIKIYNSMSLKDASKRLNASVGAIKETATQLGIARSKNGRFKKPVIITDAIKETKIVKPQYMYPFNDVHKSFCNKFELHPTTIIDSDKALKLIALIQKYILQGKIQINKPFIQSTVEGTVTNALSLLHLSSEYFDKAMIDEVKEIFV